MDGGTFVKYADMLYFIIRGVTNRTRLDSRDSMSERTCDSSNVMIIRLIDSHFRRIRKVVSYRFRRRWRAASLIAGGLESLAPLMCVTPIRVVMFHAIEGRVSIVRVADPRLSRVGYLQVLVLGVELVDLMRVSGESLDISVEVCGTRKLEQTTANIHIRVRILGLKVVDNIIHQSDESHKTGAFFTFIRL